MDKIDFYIDLYLKLPIKIWKVLYFSLFFPPLEAHNRKRGGMDRMVEWMIRWAGIARLSKKE